MSETKNKMKKKNKKKKEKKFTTTPDTHNSQRDHRCSHTTHISFQVTY